MEDPDRQRLLSAAFHDVETIVGGHAMRPLSLASYDVLLRTGNPLVKGEMPKDGTPEFTSAIMGFVFTHCAPWPEVVRASFNDQGFREAALIFCGGLTPADFQIAFKRLEETEPGTGGGSGRNHEGHRRKKAPPCDEPGFLAAQVFAVAAETGWPEERILRTEGIPSRRRWLR